MQEKGSVLFGSHCESLWSKIYRKDIRDSNTAGIRRAQVISLPVESKKEVNTVLVGIRSMRPIFKAELLICQSRIT